MPDRRRLTESRDGRVLTVTFDNPPRHFFDEQMSIEFDALTRRLQTDETVGAVVFTGRDDSYMTHFDVPSLLRGSRSVPFPLGYRPARAVSAAALIAARSRVADHVLRRTPARDLVFVGRIYAALDRLNRMDKVIVTAINGLALGMGCVFALACDIRLMADDQSIGLPESGLAVLAGAGGTQRLQRTVGTARALELLLDRRWLTAREAAELGLVHRALPRDNLQAHAQTTARRMAGRSPVINREIKRAVYGAGNLRHRYAMRREAAGLIATLSSAAATRRLAAYDEYLSDNQASLDDATILAGWHHLLA